MVLGQKPESDRLLGLSPALGVGGPALRRLAEAPQPSLNCGHNADTISAIFSANGIFYNQNNSSVPILKFP